MNQFRKYIFLFLLMISGFGLFFGNISLSSISSSEGVFLAEYHFTANEVFAENKTDTAKVPPGDNNWNETMNKVIQGVNFVLGVVTAIVSPLVGLVGWLLSPDWTSGDLFGLRKYLYALWVTVSNIIYFIYAIALIVVAVMTMFNSKNYGYRELLPRLVVGILMVPFTWWVVQWAVSVSTVLTASVLTIPMETVSQGENKDTWWGDPSIPTCVAFGGPDNEDNKNMACPDGAGGEISPKAFSEKAGGIYGSMMIYAYGVFKIHEVDQLSKDLNLIKTAAEIVHKGLIGVVMFIIFGVLMIALVFVLVLRVFKLWAYAIFSPLFTFGFVFKDSMKGTDEDDTFTVREFLGLVFLPAIIGLILSFGLILINALNSGNSTIKNAGSSETCSVEKLKGEGCTIASIMGNPENKVVRKIEPDSEDGALKTITTFTFGGVEMRWYGTSKNSKGEEVKDANSTVGFFSAAGGAFGVIILDLIAIIFVWIAFMAAKNISKTAKKIITPVESAGKSLASAAKSAPMHSIKVPGFGNIAGVQRATQGVGRYFESKSQKEWEGSKVYEMLNKNNPITKEKGEELSRSSSAVSANPSQVSNYGNINFNLRDVSGAAAITHVEQRDSNFFGKIKDAIESTSDANLRTAFGTRIGTNFKKYVNGIKGSLSEKDKITMLAYLKGWDGGASDPTNPETYILKGGHNDLRGTLEGGNKPKKKDTDKDGTDTSEEKKKEEEKKE